MAKVHLETRLLSWKYDSLVGNTIVLLETQIDLETALLMNLETSLSREYFQLADKFATWKRQ